MKKIALLGFALLTQAIFAQTTRFVYHVTMKPDSTMRTDIKTENAYLDVTSGKSIFYSEKRLVRDSVMTRMRQTNGASFDRSQMQNLRSNMDYTIAKDSKAGTTSFISRIGRDQYSYNEDRAMNWKILPETTTIGDYKVQKAETEFAGRKWTAWFTTDIPLQDGPYKFSGLPGLIVKAEDSLGDYAFDLKETKKIAAPGIDQDVNIIKVKRKDFEKQQAAFRKDPSSFMQGAMIVRSNMGGAPTPPMRMGANDPERRKMMEDRMKEEMKKNNNPLER